MEHLSSGMEQQQQNQVQWRRDKVQELCSMHTVKARHHKHCKLD